jgi:hypothetical protein
VIQIYIATAPLGQVDGDAAVATLNVAMDRVLHAHPNLRSASAAASEGVLTLTLRVAGRTRWHAQGDARKIATSMLRRVDLDVAGSKMELERTLPSANALTKVQGRSVTPRGPKVRSKKASQDPS